MMNVLRRMTMLFAITLLLSMTVVACGGDEADAPADEAPAGEGMIAKLNLNTATTDEFEMVPDVGERMAREFDEYRPYDSDEAFFAALTEPVSLDDVAAAAGYMSLD